MTEVNLNETVDGYRGSIGRLVFKRYKGRTIVGRKPKTEKPPTEAQIAHRERFGEGAGRRVVVLITDGYDERSQGTLQLFRTQ